MDAPPPLLHKNMRRPAVEGSLMSVHGVRARRRNFFSEELSAEVIYLQWALSNFFIVFFA